MSEGQSTQQSDSTIMTAKLPLSGQRGARQRRGGCPPSILAQSSNRSASLGCLLPRRLAALNEPRNVSRQGLHSGEIIAPWAVDPTDAGQENPLLSAGKRL